MRLKIDATLKTSLVWKRGRSVDRSAESNVIVSPFFIFAALVFRHNSFNGSTKVQQSQLLPDDGDYYYSQEASDWLLLAVLVLRVKKV